MTIFLRTISFFSFYFLLREINHDIQASLKFTFSGAIQGPPDIPAFSPTPPLPDFFFLLLQYKPPKKVLHATRVTADISG